MLQRVAVAALLLAACGGTAEMALDEDAVTVDTSTPAARAQYDADAAFATRYQPRCIPGNSGRPRVLVTGFGRFLETRDNATGRMVSALVPAARYPLTNPPPAGQVDDPAPQTSVALSTLNLPSGPVDVCAMIVPVHWDLAAILIAKQVDGFSPEFGLMDGVAGEVQEPWPETGS